MEQGAGKAGSGPLEDPAATGDGRGKGRTRRGRPCDG
jgi:hypothetical protein